MSGVQSKLPAMRERFPLVVTFSNWLGRVSLRMVKAAGLPELARRGDARTWPQRAAMALGHVSYVLNCAGFGETPKQRSARVRGISTV